MATMSINAATERPDTPRRRLSVVPWLTVVPPAAVMAYVDWSWMISLRIVAAELAASSAYDDRLQSAHL